MTDSTIKYSFPYRHDGDIFDYTPKASELLYKAADKYLAGRPQLAGDAEAKQALITFGLEAMLLAYGDGHWDGREFGRGQARRNSLLHAYAKAKQIG